MHGYPNSQKKTSNPERQKTSHTNMGRRKPLRDAAHALTNIFDVPPEDEVYDDIVPKATRKLG